MGIFLDEHLPDRPVNLPPMLARAVAALRAVPVDNPHWGSDALLILAGAWNEAAIHYDTHYLSNPADAARNLAALCREKAEQARALAPVFAPPAPQDAPAPTDTIPATSQQDAP